MSTTIKYEGEPRLCIGGPLDGRWMTSKTGDYLEAIEHELMSAAALLPDQNPRNLSERATAKVWRVTYLAMPMYWNGQEFRFWVLPQMPSGRPVNGKDVLQALLDGYRRPIL